MGLNGDDELKNSSIIFESNFFFNFKIELF